MIAPDFEQLRLAIFVLGSPVFVVSVAVVTVARLIDLACSAANLAAQLSSQADREFDFLLAALQPPSAFAPAVGDM